MQGTGSILFLVVMIGAMYFLMIRPQQKRDKEVREMRSNLKVGDNIITIGGIKGKVLKIGDDYVIIETSNAKTRMEFVKSAIGTVIKDEPVSEPDEDDIDEDEDDEEEDDE
ncbi:MAG: preprotein translocase subunit YajC [Miniphocaeibacter sp.]|uniref:preprotein translocase subunit YajC n=1 Tax=Miniphocaeibacter sp. TaxID=3100973 RepID=UPI0017AC1A45|nr:preprotein translocase subunit YajC [Gallicola sp.]